MVGSVTAGQGTSQLLLSLKKSAQAAQEEKTSVQTEQEKRNQQAVNTLSMLNETMKNQKASRKASAAEKVERLKKQIQALRMMAGVGDPKSVARQAARLAKELASAVKEYSGDGASMPIGVGAAVPATPAAASQSASAEGAQAEAAASGAANVSATLASAAAAAEKAEKAGQEATPGTPASPTPENKEAQKAAWEKIAAEGAKANAEKSQDEDFKNEVRNQLKSILEQQKRRAEAEGKDDPEFAKFAKDMDSVEQALQKMSTSGFEMPTVNIASVGVVIDQQV